MPKLPQGFEFRELTDEEFSPLWKQWGPKVFHENSTTLDTSLILSDSEREQCKALAKKIESRHRLNIGIFKGETFVGWFTGDQYTNETFYMRNSAILPEYRRLGLYSALLEEVIPRIQKMGFQIILSRHVTTNNSVIIPKLKAGFVISSLELSDRYGVLVHLSYYFNATRRKVMDFRAGDLKPDAQLKTALGIS